MKWYCNDSSVNEGNAEDVQAKMANYIVCQSWQRRARNSQPAYEGEHIDLIWQLTDSRQTGYMLYLQTAMGIWFNTSNIGLKACNNY